MFEDAIRTELKKIPWARSFEVHVMAPQGPPPTQPPPLPVPPSLRQVGCPAHRKTETPLQWYGSVRFHSRTLSLSLSPSLFLYILFSPSLLFSLLFSLSLYVSFLSLSLSLSLSLFLSLLASPQPIKPEKRHVRCFNFRSPTCSVATCASADSASRRLKPPEVSLTHPSNVGCPGAVGLYISICRLFRRH